MLTARGWWFLVVVVLILVLGVMAMTAYTVIPAILGVTLLIWFGLEWALFQARLNAAVARLGIRRRVVQGGREVPMVWAGLPFDVDAEVGHDGPLAVPYLVLEDRVPVASELTDWDAVAAAAIGPGRPAVIRYSLRCPSAGVLRFEGVRLRVTDLHGFFYHRAFLRDPQEYYVLPPLADDEGRQRADKRFNTLPPPGVHRFRRPGTGSELLDLRDYRAGDPPKMIAWKPSARRDRLITKEFESDVPVRCVLFLDTSEGMRLGPPGNTPLTKMTRVASTVAQAAAGNRDLVGLTTFDEDAFAGANPARTKLHLIGLLRRLAEVSAIQPTPTGVPSELLTRRAYPLALELYPDLLARRVNAMPLGRLWLPILDRWWGWVVLFMVFHPLLLVSAFRISPDRLGMPWLELLAMAARELSPRRSQVFLYVLGLIVLPAVVGGLVWLGYGVRGWFGVRRAQLTWRKRLAALFALQDGAGPAGVERLVHDEAAYADRVGRFLQQHQVRCPVPLYDDQGRYRYRGEAKADVLARALVRAVGRARDNELYVLLADLTELGSDLTPVLRAAKMARARHHHVLVIIPWPADVPPPDPATARTGEPEERPTRPPRRKPPGLERQGKLLASVRAGLTRQYHEAFRQMRRALGRVGVTVVRVDEGDPVQLVLDRLDRLRGMRSRQ